MITYPGHHLTAALNHVSTPVYVLDLEGVIGWANPAGRSLLGGARGEIVGESWLRFVAPEAQPRMRRVIARLVDGEVEALDRSITVVLPDGRAVELEATFAGVRVGVAVSGVLVFCGGPPRWRGR